jgi:hypothetical protein
MENKIDVTLTQETQGQVLAGIAALKTQMPFLTKLSDTDRETLQKLSDGRKPFVEKALDFASRNAAISPGPGMVEAGVLDINLYSFLATAETELLQLVEMVRDTKQLAGAESYITARFIYQKAKMALKMGEPGMQTIVDELGKLFKQTQAAQPAIPPAL